MTKFAFMNKVEYVTDSYTGINLFLYINDEMLKQVNVEATYADITRPLAISDA